MLKLPNSIEPAVMAENIVHLRDAESILDGRVSDLEVTAPKDYSTKETATGQKWIDGKDLYRIVIEDNFDVISETQNVTAGTIGTWLDIKDITLIIKSPLNNYIKLSNAVTYLSSNGTVTINGVSPGYSEGLYTIIILYTKSDPTPGRAPEDQEPEPEEKKTTKKKTTK